jgi:hypothetical protein
LLFLIGFRGHHALTVVLSSVAAACGISIRLVSAQRFGARSSGLAKYLSAVAHPIGVLFFLLIQWHSVLRRLAGKQATWKGRSYE